MYHRHAEGGRVSDIDVAQRAQEFPQESEVKQRLEWDWDVEFADRERERKADGDHPFPVDRPVLRELVRGHMGADIARITFISSGALRVGAVLMQLTSHPDEPQRNLP